MANASDIGQNSPDSLSWGHLDMLFQHHLDGDECTRAENEDKDNDIL